MDGRLTKIFGKIKEQGFGKSIKRNSLMIRDVDYMIVGENFPK